jgi:hypothetical protein
MSLVSFTAATTRLPFGHSQQAVSYRHHAFLRPILTNFTPGRTAPDWWVPLVFFLAIAAGVAVGGYTASVIFRKRRNIRQINSTLPSTVITANSARAALSRRQGSGITLNNDNDAESR